MTEQLYRATKTVIGSRQHLLIIDPDVATAYRDVITGERIPASILTDLHPVKVVGMDAVVIGKGDLERIHFFLEIFWGWITDGDLDSSLQSELKTILAQLSTPSEPASLGENKWKCGYCNYDAEKGGTLSHNCVPQSPKGVTIEGVSAFDFNEFLVDIVWNAGRIDEKCSTERYNEGWKYIRQLEPQLPPPLAEPKAIYPSVIASIDSPERSAKEIWTLRARGDWMNSDGWVRKWSDLINPTKEG